MQITKAARQFLPENLAITEFGVLAPFFQELLEREVNDLKDFDQWLSDRSELDAVLEEDLVWRYIRMSTDTTKAELRDAHNQFVTQIQPELAPLEDQLNQKIMPLPLS